MSTRAIPTETFQIRWDIDLDADNHKDAAYEALRYLTELDPSDPDGPLVFTVTSQRDNRAQVIDLGSKTEAAIDAVPRLVIGVSGQARCGKDTVTEMLVRHHGATRIAFADPLREAAYSLDPLIPVAEKLTGAPARHVRLSELIDLCGWEEATDTYPEIRRTLQKLGTEAGWRIHGRDLWIRAAARVMADLPADRPVVFSDVRFPHEVDWIRSIGGHLVVVERPEHLRSTRLDERSATHTSEALRIDSPDHVICNDSDLDDLRCSVEVMIARFTRTVPTGH